MLSKLTFHLPAACIAWFIAISPLTGFGAAQGLFTDHTGEEDPFDLWRASSTGLDRPTTPAVPPRITAESSIRPLAGSGVTGAARLRKSGDQVILVVTLKGAPPGEHAIHIHEFGDCSNEGMAAGGHWNPTNQQHGRWGSASFHLGDIGNIKIRPDGTATLLFKTDLWKLGGGGPRDVVEKSIVIHSGADDFVSQPSGNSGTRIACGMISSIGLDE
jgi:Cu-Zn family superoxide dismutase